MKIVITVVFMYCNDSWLYVSAYKHTAHLLVWHLCKIKHIRYAIRDESLLNVYYLSCVYVCTNMEIWYMLMHAMLVEVIVIIFIRDIYKGKHVNIIYIKMCNYEGRRRSWERWWWMSGEWWSSDRRRSAWIQRPSLFLTIPLLASCRQKGGTMKCSFKKSDALFTNAGSLPFDSTNLSPFPWYLPSKSLIHVT